jgi:predicted P-loop ATPase/GTPase
MRFLIVGLLPYNSGKTTTAVAMIRGLIQMGEEVKVLKPIAGHDVWYQYEALVRSSEMGILVGEDAVSLLKASNSRQEVYEVNPIDVLVGFYDYHYWSSIQKYVEQFSFLNPIVIRISTCEGVSKYYVDQNGISKLPNTIGERLYRHLKALKGEMHSVEREIMNGLLEEAPRLADECVKKIIREGENVVIESYNDASSPTRHSLNVDYVIAVSPARAFIYSAKDYVRSLEYNNRLDTPWLIKASRVVSSIEPENTVTIYPGKEFESYMDLNFVIRRILRH